MTISEGARKCIVALLCDTTLRRATFFAGPNLTIKATRRHRVDKRQRSVEFVVSMGQPNFRERAWIKQLRAAGCLFPQRKLKFDYWPKRKAK